MARDGGIGTQTGRDQNTGMEAVRGGAGVTEKTGKGDDRGTEETIGRGDGGDLIRGHGSETELRTANDVGNTHLLDLVHEKGMLKDALDTGADHHVGIVMSEGGRAATYTIPKIKV